MVVVGLVAKSCPTPGSSVHGVSQARTLEQDALSFPGDLLYPRIEPASPALAGIFFTTEPQGSHMYKYLCHMSPSIHKRGKCKQ